MLPLLSVLAKNTLLKTAYHFLLLLVGFDTLTYRKGYDRSPTLVGHHPQPREATTGATHASQLPPHVPKPLQQAHHPARQPRPTAATSMHRTSPHPNMCQIRRGDVKS